MQKIYRVRHLLINRFVAGWAGLLVLLSGCAPKTCCPEGPPYAYACSESFYYYFHGNQLQQGPTSGNAFLNQAPWRHLGRVLKGSGGGSGVLIHENFVLTAAHVVMKGNQFDNSFVSFSLAQPCPSCLPYGRRVASRIWVPEEWINNIGGDYDSIETRAYDWALLELDLSTSLFNPSVPPPVPMGATQQAFSSFEHLTPRAAGYACGRQASGAVRRKGSPFATDDSGAFLGQQQFPSTPLGAQGGALYKTSLEATGGMSGGPVWIEQGGEALLVGVMIGSPQQACNKGENWVAGLSPTTRQRIQAVIGNGQAPGMVSHAPMGGGGGFQLCTNLFSPVQSACPPPLGVDGEADCTNPEKPDR